MASACRACHRGLDQGWRFTREEKAEIWQRGHDAGPVADGRDSGGRMIIRIVVYGSPAPQSSKSFKGLAKSGRAILAESSKQVRPWWQDLKLAAQQLRAQLGVQMLDEPLVVCMTFNLHNPKL